MATLAQTTRERTAGPTASAGATSRNAVPSVRDPLQVDGPRVLLRMPDLSMRNVASAAPEQTAPVAELPLPIVPAIDPIAPVTEEIVPNVAEWNSTFEEAKHEPVIARTMPGLAASNVIVQSYESLPPPGPKNESPRYMSLASAINQLQVSEPAKEKPLAENKPVAEAVAKAKPNTIVEKPVNEMKPSLVATKPSSVETKPEAADVTAALQSSVTVAAAPSGRFKSLMILARNPKMVLSCLLVMFSCLALAMFFVPSGDPISDAPSTAGGSNPSANIAPAYVPPSVQLPPPSMASNPNRAGQNVAPAFVPPASPVAPPNMTLPSTRPAVNNGPSFNPNPSINKVPTTATAPSGNQQSSAAPPRTSLQPRVAELEGGIGRPTLEATHERARPSYR